MNSIHTHRIQARKSQNAMREYWNDLMMMIEKPTVRSLSPFSSPSHTHTHAGTHTYTDRATVLSRTCFTRFASAVPSDKCHKHWHQGETWRSIKLLSWLLRFEYFNFCCPWMQSSPSTNTSPCQPNVFSWTVTLFSYYLLMLGANLKKSSCDPSLKTHL